MVTISMPEHSVPTRIILELDLEPLMVAGKELDAPCNDAAGATTTLAATEAPAGLGCRRVAQSKFKLFGRFGRATVAVTALAWARAWRRPNPGAGH